MSELLSTQNPIKFVFADFETFYGGDYTLRKLDPPSYILDECFEAICLGVAEGNDNPYLVEGPDIPRLLTHLGDNIALVTHNALFDACILSWRYNYVPKLLVDTLSMSRTLLSHKLKRHDLGSVGAEFGYTKIQTTLPKVEGMTGQMIKDAGLWDAYTHYCKDDTNICRGIFQNLAPLLPVEEFVLHDMILRCAVEPSFRVDMDVLYQNLEEVKSNKQKLFLRAMFAGLDNVEQLRSNDQFAELLQSMGVDPPKKVSPLTGRLTWALAKTDPQFLELLEHDEPRIVALAEARIAWKTSIEQTRTERMINIGHLTFEGKGTGWMPIPLVVGAAHTHRLGGGWKLNPQNWGRKSLIRHAIVAPEGHKVVAADSEQIEARINAWFCGQNDLVEAFARKEDVYSKFAEEEIYHVPVTKATEPAKRFVGKTGILQLGYQCGDVKFRKTVWLLSYNDPNMPEPIDIVPEEALRIVSAYRARYSRIKYMWDRLRDLIPYMAHMQGNESFAELGPIKIGRQRIIGPNGLEMQYHNLQRISDGTGQWVYEYGGVPHKIYGGKFLENIVQFLARIAVMQAAVRLRKKLVPYSCRLTHTAHDEIIYIVRDEYVAEVAALIKAEMCVTPVWAPGLPLSASVGIGQSYGDCK